MVINDKNSYEVKDLSEAQKKDIIDMVIEDESTRTNISNADRKIR
ncbi:MAG: hypothetical protein WCJ39_05315 [bacterium]